MQQYFQHLKDILEKGRQKSPSRPGLPGSISLFGYQWRHNLADGFPLLTSKKVFWKGVVVELLWFLRGDTNIKFLDQHGVRKMWHEDAYNYYKMRVVEFNESMKRDFKATTGEPYQMEIGTFERFCEVLADNSKGGDDMPISWGGDSARDYLIGDCGYQYGKLWRDWETQTEFTEKSGKTYPNGEFIWKTKYRGIDQIANLIDGLKTSPEGRRHLLNAWDPAHLDDMALNACHNLAQWNCRKLTEEERWKLVPQEVCNNNNSEDVFKNYKIPEYYLDCEMYQRSADMFLGVPLNIASYALLTHILAKLVGMEPGEMIYTYGDSHIYDNHLEQVNELLTRTPTELPKLNINTEFWLTESGECGTSPLSVSGFLRATWNENFIKCLMEDDIQLSNYNPQAKIEAKLSTGLK